jgi:serine phosphatase RsbU (regulator of sigma subunit)/Tfp pilus assembly protein PilF
MRFKYFILLISLFILNGYALAQQTKSDSLQNLLKTASQEEKISIYHELSSLGGDSDERLKYSQEALKQAILLDNPEIIVNSYIKLSEIYRSGREYKMAEEQLTSAMQIARSRNDHKNLARINNHLANLAYDQNDHAKSQQYSNEALSIAREHGVPDEEAGALFNLGNVSRQQNKLDEAQEYYLKALEIRRKLDDKERLAASLNGLGNLYYSKGDYQNAIRYQKENYEIRSEINDLFGSGIALNNMANASIQLGNLEEAINYYKEANAIFKKEDFKPGIAATLTGMALIYENLDQKEAALVAQKEILELRKAQGDKRELANAYNNIGILYSKILQDSLIGRYGRQYRDTIMSKPAIQNFALGREAIESNRLALEIRKELNDIRGYGIALANLGVSYFYIGEIEKARQTLEEWVQMAEEIDDPDQTVTIHIALGMIYSTKNQLAEALNSFNLALELAKESGKYDHFVQISENLAEIYEKLGNYRKAFEYHRLFTAYKDSLVSEEGRKIIHEMQIIYETEAKDRENELLRKDQIINETKLRNSRRALFAAVSVVLIFIGLVVQLIRQNNLRRKANEELARKNALITEQKKEITDSIMYASRIQNAMLPPGEIISGIIPEHFVMYRPRDIVSGDFYWITEKNNRVVVMIADCTGHGVPGAFMSMLGVAYLNEIITKNENFTADLILNELRKQVVKSLHQTGREGESQDGMDVALYIIDRTTMQVEYAGANNPLFIFRNGEFTELAADKMPIGIHKRINESFIPKSFQLEKGDMIYAFSDGYPDQFGGEHGKKFMIKNFRNLLSSIHQMTMKEQKAILESTLDKWMANTNQIDDILVMGVRV